MHKGPVKDVDVVNNNGFKCSGRDRRTMLSFAVVRSEDVHKLGNLEVSDGSFVPSGDLPYEGWPKDDVVSEFPEGGADVGGTFGSILNALPYVMKEAAKQDLGEGEAGGPPDVVCVYGSSYVHHREAMLE